MRDTDELALEYRCDYCRAAVGEWCRTSSGRRATWLHTGRTWAIQQAWGMGYQDSDKYYREELQRRKAAILKTLAELGERVVDAAWVEEVVTSIMNRRWL